MNIGIDIRALAIVKRSGVGTYVFHALRNIVAIDQENDYYLFSSGRKNKLVLPKELQRKNIKHVHLFWPNKLLNLIWLFGFGPTIDSLFPVKLDVVWLPNINFYKLKPKTPLILTIHDLSFLHSQKFYSFKRKWWHTLVNVRKIVDRANFVISVSHNTKRDIMRFFTIAEEKIKVIYPGVDSKKVDQEKAKQFLAKYKISPNYFIYLGTLEPRKNIDNIIKAFDKYHIDYPEVDLVLVGNKGWIYQRLLRDVKKRKYIKYLGFIDSPTKDFLYALSQGLIWPSFYEGFGFPPLEATWHQVPVIISYKTSLPEIMKSQALYIDPYNPADLYQVLKELTMDNRLREKIKDSAKEFQVPNWPEQSQKIINLFKQCE